MSDSNLEDRAAIHDLFTQCCESSSEERSAGNPHATFCGNRGRATASGDPVGGTARCPPIPISIPRWSGRFWNQPQLFK